VTQKQNNVIRVSDTEFNVETKGGVFDFYLEYNVNDYKISCSANWVAIKENSDTRGLSKKRLSVSVGENTSGAPRTAVINISSELAYQSVYITIYQEYKIDYYFNMLRTDYEIDERGGNVSVSAQTNMTSFDIYPPDDMWAKLGDLEFFPDLFAVIQHVNVDPFKEKTASRTTTMYMHDTAITITQYRNIYIKESGISMLRQESGQLSAYTSDGEAVTWSSSNENVAKVDANGLVTGVGVGTATITATSSNGKFTDSVPVTIEKPQDLRNDLNVEWQPYFDDNNEVASLSCTLNNDSKYNIQLTRCEIYSDLKLLSYLDYNEKSGTLVKGDSKKASFDNLAGKGSKFGFTVVWYYTFYGEKFTYRCEYPLN
jgi:uncharacterized protein YjdB